MTVYVSEFMQSLIFSDEPSNNDIGQVEVGTAFWNEYCEYEANVRTMRGLMTQKFYDEGREKCKCDTPCEHEVSTHLCGKCHGLLAKGDEHE